ncbi:MULTISPECIES: hypothetical protein [Microcystis]|uniref:hypothetical protein n=1 Tax=Microcystis TaxID=1125 RepID=UPI0006892818|nr:MULTISPECIES: hypothetical protein [Microcystis]
MRKKIAIYSFLLGISIVAGAIFGNLYFSRLTIVPSSAPHLPPTKSATSLGVVEEIVSNLEWGNIAFDTPKKMKFEEPKTILVQRIDSSRLGEMLKISATAERGR